jgi:hypothetical protein
MAKSQQEIKQRDPGNRNTVVPQKPSVNYYAYINNKEDIQTATDYLWGLKG